ncbi:hypothetical protein AKO1_012593 [Acrasis kona]|uniref:Uncharacterized protein n=1 Tax=Acrasis kona TaxID=1008807 RepID=A0AAW2YWA7_9EUKA
MMYPYIKMLKSDTVNRMMRPDVVNRLSADMKELGFTDRAGIPTYESRAKDMVAEKMSRTKLDTYVPLLSEAIDNGHDDEATQVIDEWIKNDPEGFFLYTRSQFMNLDPFLGPMEDPYSRNYGQRAFSTIEYERDLSEEDKVQYEFIARRMFEEKYDAPFQDFPGPIYRGENFTERIPERKSQKMFKDWRRYKYPNERVEEEPFGMTITGGRYNELYSPQRRHLYGSKHPNYEYDDAPYEYRAYADGGPLHGIYDIIMNKRRTDFSDDEDEYDNDQIPNKNRSEYSDDDVDLARAENAKHFGTEPQPYHSRYNPLDEYADEYDDEYFDESLQRQRSKKKLIRTPEPWGRFYVDRNNRAYLYDEDEKKRSYFVRGKRGFYYLKDEDGDYFQQYSNGDRIYFVPDGHGDFERHPTKKPYYTTQIPPMDEDGTYYHVDVEGVKKPLITDRNGTYCALEYDSDDHEHFYQSEEDGEKVYFFINRYGDFISERQTGPIKRLRHGRYVVEDEGVKSYLIRDNEGDFYVEDKNGLCYRTNYDGVRLYFRGDGRGNFKPVDPNIILQTDEEGRRYREYENERHYLVEDNNGKKLLQDTDGDFYGYNTYGTRVPYLINEHGNYELHPDFVRSSKFNESVGAASRAQYAEAEGFDPDYNVNQSELSDPQVEEEVEEEQEQEQEQEQQQPAIFSDGDDDDIDYGFGGLPLKASIGLGSGGGLDSLEQSKAFNQESYNALSLDDILEDAESGDVLMGERRTTVHNEDNQYPIEQQELFYRTKLDYTDPFTYEVVRPGKDSIVKDILTKEDLPNLDYYDKMDLYGVEDMASQVDYYSTTVVNHGGESKVSNMIKAVKDMTMNLDENEFSKLKQFIDNKSSILNLTTAMKDDVELQEQFARYSEKLRHVASEFVKK